MKVWGTPIVAVVLLGAESRYLLACPLPLLY